MICRERKIPLRISLAPVERSDPPRPESVSRPERNMPRPGLPLAMRANLLDPSIMGPPIVWLASPDAAGVHDQRIIARDFDDWLQAREKATSL